MVHISQLDHLEYKEAILDSPEFREKLKKHEKYITDTSKNIKLLLKKFEEVILASETLRNAQDSFSTCLKEFGLGLVGGSNEEEIDIVDTLNSTYLLIQEIKEFSTKMINTGNSLFQQFDLFRKEHLNTFKERKKEYERQTVKYCTTNDKYLASSQSKDKDYGDLDKDVKEENQYFYKKCLDYILCIQEFEEKWFHFFAQSVFAFIQSWTTFFHEGYEKHIDYEDRFSKSNGGLQQLRNNFEYFKTNSNELIHNILKDPEHYLSSYETVSSEQNNSPVTFKQGYLYLLEKKTIGSSARVKQFCKYYKETKRLEATPYNQITNKSHQTEIYYVNNCQKSTSDKRFVFDVSLKENKSVNSIYTFQAMSYDDYKAWFAIMDGKELTPVLSNYSVKSDPVYILDKNGLNFIKRCIQLLEDDKLNEEGMYRKNGVAHKINQFIERNFTNISSSLVQSAVNNENIQTNNENIQNNNHTQSQSTASLMVSVLKNTIPHSTSSSTLSLSTNQNIADSHNHNTQDKDTTTTNNMSRNYSCSNMLPNTNSNGNNYNNSFASEVLEDTCTITSALKHYLIRLNEPLMTFSFNQQFLNACKIEILTDRVNTIHKLIYSLPPFNLEALELLMKHLYIVSTHSQQNKMTTSNLATCLGPTVFRTEQECVSNLYNIKFYSEIIELLIIHNEHMFQTSLNENFLKNLIPLKSPPTMISGTLSISGGLNSSTNSSVSPLFSQNITPLPPSNSKVRLALSNNNNINSRRGNNYEPTYRNALINSSKTSVSSDSSQNSESRDHQNITSPLSSSSPTQFQNGSSSNNHNNIHQTSNNVHSNRQLVNNISNNDINVQNKPYKPFNSQTGQFFQRNKDELDNSLNGLSKSSSSGNNHNSNRTSTMFSSSNVSHVISNISNMISTLSPKDSNAINKSLISSPMNTTKLTNNLGQNPISTVSTTSLNSSSKPVLSPLAYSDSSTLNTSSNNSFTKLRRARTLYPCEADNPSELSFEANVIISNVRRSKESGWLEGTYNGKSGLVPGNYVQILDE